jgi:hypothetical protein
MNFRTAWKLRLSSQSSILVIAGCMLLCVPAILQYRSVQERRLEALAAQQQARREAIRKEAESRRVWLLQQTSKVKDPGRIDQLYREISDLMHMSDRVQSWAPGARSETSKK